MITTAYARGAAFERRVRDALEARGWWVIRSAGSHSPADLVAWGPTACWMVQAKRSGLPSLADRVALLAWAERAQATAVLVRPLLRGLDWRTWDHRARRWVPLDAEEPWGT